MVSKAFDDPEGPPIVSYLSIEGNKSNRVVKPIRGHT